MKINANQTKTTINNQDEYVKVKQFAAGKLQDVQFTQNSLQPNLATDYFISASGSATPEATDTKYFIALFKNGTLISETERPFSPGRLEADTWAISGIVETLEQTDQVALYVKNSNGTEDLTIGNSNVTITSQEVIR